MQWIDLPRKMYRSRRAMVIQIGRQQEGSARLLLGFVSMIRVIES